MKVIRILLVKVVGLKGYLRIISRIYIGLISMGLLKKKYAELFFIKQLTNPGDTVLDIGANLGYYSYFLSKNIGKTGHLLAVEPIPLFTEVWRKNMRKFKTNQIDLFNCALGSEEKATVEMSIPIVNGVVRHGLTQVNDQPNNEAAYLNFEVPMKIGDQLLSSKIENRLTFIKCDVEGYEQYVIPSLEGVISEHLPVLQIELGGEENKANVVDFLLKLCYKVFILKGEKLIPIQKKDIFSVAQDFYFIHESEVENKQHLIHN